MYTDPAHLHTQRVPCALQHYLCQMDPKAISRVLSRRERQMAFQHWVAYIRGSDCGHPSDVTPKEHLMCPLLWCRESFDNLASTLQHVSECPWLSNTWYWCPYCCRPESFIASEDPYINIQRFKLQRKDSKMRRAVTFFKHLGLKSCSRHRRSGSSSSSVPGTESYDTWLAKRMRFEMEDTSPDTSSPMELAATSSETPSRRSKSEKQSKTVYEMEGATIYASWNYDDPPHYTLKAGTAAQPGELGDDSFVEAPPPRPAGDTANNRDSLTGIGPLFEGANHDVETVEEMLVSPVSASQAPVICRTTREYTSSDAESGLVSPTYSNSPTVPLSELVEDSWCQIEVTPALESSPCDTATLSTQSQIDELREMVRVLNEEWVRRCQPYPVLVLRASAWSPRSLFETGAQALQDVFRGVLPETFDAVVALAHVACATAYIMHGDDRSHCWNEFFQDMLKWQRLMPNKSDAGLFVRLVNLLLGPQGTSAHLSCGNYFLDETSGTLVPLRRPAVGFDPSSSIETDGMQPRRWYTKPASTPMLSSLKNGAVLQECLRFLDGIEYAAIMERSKHYPTHLAWYAQNHVTNIEELLKTIIHPLQSCDGIEALHGSVNHTATELRNGSLRSVREVEVSLTSNGKSLCLSPQVYTRYIDAVTSVCDRILHEAGPNWRDRCYATHLDLVLASDVEMKNRQRLEQVTPRHQRKTEIAAVPDVKRTPADGAPMPLFTETQTPIGSLPSTTASPTHTHGFSPATQPSSTTSPMSFSSAPSPSPSSTDVARCPLCPAVFTGSARDRTSNLKRHLRTTRNHGNAVGLLCTVSGCGAILSRSDNLGKHVRTVHQDQGDAGTVLRRQDARKRRRDIEGAD